MIALGFLLIVGQEAAYAAWISSYVVLNNFSTKEHAIFYSGVYWVSITVFRFVLTLLRGRASVKVRYFGIMGIGIGLVCLFLIYHVDTEFGLLSMSVMYGFAHSVIIPLLLTIPQEFGYQLTLK